MDKYLKTKNNHYTIVFNKCIWEITLLVKTIGLKVFSFKRLTNHALESSLFKNYFA